METPSNISFHNGDLFQSPNDFSLAHCVSEDLVMARGIADSFRVIYAKDYLESLKKQQGKVGQTIWHATKDRPFIFYLITKEKYKYKPTCENFLAALKDLKRLCLGFGVSKLAIPKIGCGLDKLDWNQVHKMIINEFSDMEIEIRVYFL